MNKSNQSFKIVLVLLAGVFLHYPIHFSPDNCFAGMPLTTAQAENHLSDNVSSEQKALLPLLGPEIKGFENLWPECQRIARLRARCSQNRGVTKNIHSLVDELPSPDETKEHSRGHSVESPSKDSAQALDFEFTQCLGSHSADKLLEVSAAPNFFNHLSLDTLNQIKTILAEMQEFAKKPDSPYSKLTNKIEVLKRRFDPYTENPKTAFEQLFKILSFAEQSPPERTDIRDVALYSELMFNPEFQKKVNGFTQSSPIAAQPFLRNDQLEAEKDEKGNVVLTKAQVQIREFYRIKDRIADLTNTGRFIPNLAQVREAVTKKSNNYLNARARNEKFEPEFTADELWVMYHDAKQKNRILNWPSNSRFNPIKEKLATFVPASEQAIIEMKRQIASRLEPGDFTFTAMTKSLAYNHRTPSKYNEDTRFYTRSDYDHAALVVKPTAKMQSDRAAELFHINGGVRVEENGIVDAYRSDTYRIRLDKLMKDKLAQKINAEARAMNLSPEETFKRRVNRYAEQYRDDIEREFVQPRTEGDYLKIDATEQAKRDSVIKGWTPYRPAKDVFEKVAQARQIPPAPSAPLVPEEQEIRADDNSVSRRLLVAQSDMNSLEDRLNKMMKANKKPDKRMTGQLKNLSRELAQKAIDIGDLESEQQAILLQEENVVKKPELPIEDRKVKVEEINQRKLREVDKAEICSTFAFNEYVRYVKFLEDQFKKDYQISLPEKDHLFDLSFADRVDPSALHPGGLSRVIEGLVKKSQAEVVNPNAGLFKH